MNERKFNLDLTEIAFTLGEVRREQKTTNELLKKHIEGELALDNRLKGVEDFVGNSKKYANIIGTVVAGLISFATLKWMK